MSSTFRTTDLERENLEAHVELSMERFSHLDSRVVLLEKDIKAVDQSIETLERSVTKQIEELTKDINRMIFGAAVALITGLSSAVFTFITK